MGTDASLRHHKKFFDGLRQKFLEDQAAIIKGKKERHTKNLLSNRSKFEQASLAFKAADGNNSAAARLLGWSISKFRWVLYNSQKPL